MFGEEIYNNIKNTITKPLGKYIMYNNCGKRILKTNNRIKYCEECATIIDRKKANIRMKKI